MKVAPIRTRILSLRFTESQVEMIDKVAAEQGVTPSRLIRQAVGRYVFDLGAIDDGRDYQRRKAQ